MAGFGFTEEQETLRQEVRRFAQEELAPGAMERSKMQPAELHGALSDISKKIIELGWTRINVPEKYGGYPLGHVEIGIIIEESHKVDPTIELPRRYGSDKRSPADTAAGCSGRMVPSLNRS